MKTEVTGRFTSGRFEACHAVDRIPVVNPATEEVVGAVPDGDAHDVDRAVGAARGAFLHSGWAQLSPAARASYIRALAEVLERRGPELAELVTRQNGMPITMSMAGNGLGLGPTYRYFAALADQLEVEEERIAGGTRTIVRREPLGVAALIVPWNAPQVLAAWKLGPALAAGCTAVLKPAPETTLDAYLLAEAVVEAGIPSGVVNVVPGGRETGDLLVRHPGIDKVAFTGSTAAGRAIAAACADALKPVTLELGGKSAAIVLDDADLDAFGRQVASVSASNTGQVCRACTRILAPRARYDEVVEVVAEAMAAAPMGDPMDPGMIFGPLVAARQQARVEGYVELGIREGAKLALGGGRPAGFDRGYFVQPTVFRDVDNAMRIAQEEIFGPVLVVIPYDDDDDAVAIANDSDYGLGGFIATSDEGRGVELARRIETGAVGINHYPMPLGAPFGGYKQSGLGRELGPESVDAYMQTKAIYLLDDQAT